MSERRQGHIQSFVAEHFRNRHFVVDSVLNHPVFIIPAYVAHTAVNFLVERFDPSPKVREAIEKFSPENATFKDKIVHEITFFQRARLFDMGARVANGLRLQLSSLDTEFGNALKSIYTDVKFRDHGHEHFRRIKDFIKLILLNSPEIKIKWLPAIDALAGISHSHDLTQALVKVWNDKYGWTKENGMALTEKLGHDLSGAILRLATFREYAHERNITDRESWEIACAEAYLCLGHDDEVPLAKEFAATKSARHPDYEIEDLRIDGTDFYINSKLIDDFKNREIDITTLSPHQIMMLMIYKLNDNRIKAIANGQDTKYGLMPDIEKQFPILDDFVKQTIPVIGNDDIDFNKPMFDNLTGEQRESLQNIKTIFIISDRMDMYAPFETICRKFMVQRSKKRVFLKGSYDDIVREINAKEFDNSDLHRIIHEINTADQILEGTNFEDSIFTKKLIRDHQFAALMHLDKFGDRFMNGDMGVFDDIYDRRLYLLGRKVLRKLKVPQSEMDQIPGYMTDSRRALDMINSLALKYGHGPLVDRYTKSYEIVRKEQQEVLASIKEKPNNRILPEGEYYRYSEDEIEIFHRVCQRFQEDLFARYSQDEDLPMTESELNEVRSLVDIGESPPLGNSTIDSTGGMADMKTFISHRESGLVRLLLKWPAVSSYVNTGEIIQERNVSLEEAKQDLFEGLGLGHIFHNKALPKHVSYETHARLVHLREAGFEPALRQLVNDVLSRSPNHTAIIGSINKNWRFLGAGTSERQVSAYQEYVWNLLRAGYGENREERYFQLRSFAEKGYLGHLPRRTGETFINHPLALVVMTFFDLRHDRAISKNEIFSQDHLEMGEIAVLHDLVEDNPEHFAFYYNGKDYMVINKDDHSDIFTLSKEQYLILNALTRIRGRENEWLNQILRLPFDTRVKAAKIKIKEIVHNLYNGVYNSYPEAVKRTEEQHRTLYVLSLASVLSIRHPWNTVKDVAKYLSGLQFDERLKIMIPTLCASDMNTLYMFEANREFARRVRLIADYNETRGVADYRKAFQDTSSTDYEIWAKIQAAKIISPLYIDDREIQSKSKKKAVRYYFDLPPRRRNKEIARIAGRSISSLSTNPSGTNYIPLSLNDLQVNHLIMNSKYQRWRWVANPEQLGTFSNIWFVGSARNNFLMSMHLWKVQQRKRNLSKVLHNKY